MPTAESTIQDGAGSEDVIRNSGNKYPKAQYAKAANPAELSQADMEREKAQIEGFIRGEVAGFKYVYAKFRERVFSYCLYYMGEQMLAEDAFQEVFSRVYTHREQLRETKALKSWLLQITRSVCLNMLRTSKFTPEFVSIDASRDSDDGPMEFPELSAETTDTSMTEEVLRLALQRLAPMYREAFLLREFEGYDYEEIATITSTSVMNVKVRITRAKKRLRQILAPYFDRVEKPQRTSNQRDTDQFEQKYSDISNDGEVVRL